MSNYFLHKKQDHNIKHKQEDILKKKLSYKHHPNALNNKTVVTKKKVVNKKIDLSQYCSAVRDQGEEGCCTAFATIACMEFIEKKFNKNNYIDLSESFTYYITRSFIMKESPVTDSGAYISDVIDSLIKYGTCKLSTFPYVDNPLLEPPSNAYIEAKAYHVVQYANIISIETMKSVLDAGYAIIGGFICYSNIHQSKNGIIPLPNKDIIGGHAVLFVGYDDNTKLFKFKNSWGEFWGDKGYGYLPYEYFYHGDLTELWVIFIEDINNVHTGISII